MSAQPGIHRLRPNHREWSPAQIIIIHPHTAPHPAPDGIIHRMTSWAARLDVRRARNPDHEGIADAWGVTASGLAEQVHHWCRSQRSVWIIAHDLSRMLTLTRLPAGLNTLGWEVTAHAVTSDSPWLRMRRGDTVITMADGQGWLRAGLPQLTRDLGIDGPWSPSTDPELPDWAMHAMRGADITWRAMTQILEWWDTNQLGSWTLTGSGCAWNSYRHWPDAVLPLIIPGDAENGHDRLAVYGGRREAFRWGQLEGGPWRLLDFRNAYPVIAASMPLPVARQGVFESLSLDSPLVCGAGYGIIAEVEVETDVPRWPVRVSGRVAYPVGRFATVMAGPEILEARRLGCLIRIGPGRLHALSDHLQGWARWALNMQDAGNDDITPVIRRYVKHAGRAVIGKFGARGYETRPLRSLGGDGWLSVTGWNAEMQAPCHLTEVCGSAAETIQSGDGDNAYPAVLAFTESWVRVFLDRAMEAIGRGSVVCCDTDGLVVSAPGTPARDGDMMQFGPLELRGKRTYAEMRVIGPQHIITDSDRKLSGVPRSAIETPSGQWEALLSPRLGWQIEHSQRAGPGGYLQPRHVCTLPESLITGWCTTYGTVEPLTAVICRHDGTHLLDAVHTYDPDAPLARQASHLASMFEPVPQEGQSCSHHSYRPHGRDAVSTASNQTRYSASGPKKDGRRAGKVLRWLARGATTVISALRG